MSERVNFWRLTAVSCWAVACTLCVRLIALEAIDSPPADTGPGDIIAVRVGEAPFGGTRLFAPIPSAVGEAVGEGRVYRVLNVGPWMFVDFRAGDLVLEVVE